MMTPKRRRRFGPILLVTVGIAVMLAGLGVHWWKPDVHKLEWIPQLVGACIAFAGFYGMDPKGAMQGGGFIASAGTRVLGVIRTGERASDPVVTVTKSVEPITPPFNGPLDEADIPPTIPAHPGGE